MASYKFPIAIFLVAMILRAWIAMPGFSHLHMNGAYTADSPRYERLGLTLAQEGVYEAHPLIEHKGLREERGTDKPLYSGPEYFRVPGYPVFLAGIFKTVGYSTQVVLAVQVVLSALTCVLLYFIGKWAHSDKLGILAAVLMALNLKAGVHAGQVTSETLFTFLLVACVAAGLWLWKKETVYAAIICAIVFVFMALTRPVGLHLGIIFSLVALIVFWGKKRLIMLSLVPFFSVLVALNAWSYRNYEKSGVWAPTSNAAITLGLHFPSLIWSHAKNEPVRDGQLEILRRNAEANPQYRYIYEAAKADPRELYVWSEGFVHDIKFAEHLKPIGIKLMLEEWPTTLYTMVSGGVWSLFSGMGEWRNWIVKPEEYQVLKDRHYIEDLKKHLGRIEIFEAADVVWKVVVALPAKAVAVFVVMGLYQLVLVFFALKGLPALVAKPGRALGLLVVLWIIYIMATSGLSGNSRYLAPALPLFSLAAAFGIDRWIRRDSAAG